MDAMQIMRTVARISEIDAIVMSERAAFNDLVWNSEIDEDWNTMLNEEEARMRARTDPLSWERADLYVDMLKAGVLEGTGVTRLIGDE